MRAGLKVSPWQKHILLQKKCTIGILDSNIGGSAAEGLDINMIENHFNDKANVVIHLNPLQELIQPEGNLVIKVWLIKYLSKEK
jgi:isopentenyl diphosphate isomerase/L-lactate dehydrogenase-like FMN-dependent dehydrogenase